MGLVDQIVGVESGGDARATNPRSSATGAGQFLASTWLDTLAKHRPDITGSPDELLALRNDPNLSREMTAAYAGDNGGILKQAGLPVTPGTQYLAHFAGPQGAVGLLNADPSTPAGAVLGAGVVRANPFLAKMTAGQVAAWADGKMGGGGNSPMSLAGPGAGAGTAPAAPAQPSQPAAQQQWTAAPSAPPVDLNALAAVPALGNILPARPNLLFGRRTAPFSLRG